MSQLKKEPDVDIIIPNFNKAKFLDECIQSVIQQSYSNWKLFIIDDASKDNSINISNLTSRYNNDIEIDDDDPDYTIEIITSQ